MAGRSGADEAVALIQTGHATAKREPGISGRLMNGEEGTTKTLTKTTRSACDATKGRTRGRFARVGKETTINGNNNMSIGRENKSDEGSDSRCLRKVVRGSCLT